MALPIAAVVAGALIDPTTFGNEVVTALNAAPRGTVGYAQVTANQAGITTIADITGVSVTWTAVAGRRYRISVKAMLISSVATDDANVWIRDSANVKYEAFGVNCPSTTHGINASGSAIVTGLGAGSKTFKLSVERATGTGTITAVAGADFPMYILVEDIGT